MLPGDPLRSRLDGTGAEIVEGDIRAPETLVAATAGVDAVAHLAAVILARDPRDYDAINRRGTANLVAAAAVAGVRHFVYVSSASVVYPRLTPYGRAKLDAENIVAAETRMAHTIVRPTLVYDETGGQEFMLFRKYLRRFPVVPFVGPGAAKKRPVYSDDVVDGLARIVGNDVCFGKTYNLSGPEAITLRDLAKLVLELEGAPRPFLHVPLPICRARRRSPEPRHAESAPHTLCRRRVHERRRSRLRARGRGLRLCATWRAGRPGAVADPPFRGELSMNKVLCPGTIGRRVAVWARWRSARVRPSAAAPRWAPKRSPIRRRAR